MQSLRKTLGVIVGAALLPLLISCGPSYDDREKAREAERQQALAADQRALAAFAERYRATPVELFEVDPRSQPITARLQEKLEGSIVAFRSSLRDVVRTSPDHYELVLGHPFFEGTVVTLGVDQQTATTLLADSPDEYSSFLVVAQIEKVTSVTLELRSCAQPQCEEVGLRSNLFGRTHRVFGNAIAIERER